MDILLKMVKECSIAALHATIHLPFTICKRTVDRILKTLLTELVEVGLDLLSTRLLAHAPHKDLLCLVVFRLRLGGGVLRVDLLAVQGVGGYGQHPVHRVRVGEGDETETAASLQQ